MTDICDVNGVEYCLNIVQNKSLSHMQSTNDVITMIGISRVIRHSRSLARSPRDMPCAEVRLTCHHLTSRADTAGEKVIMIYYRDIVLIYQAKRIRDFGPDLGLF